MPARRINYYGNFHMSFNGCWTCCGNSDMKETSDCCYQCKSCGQNMCIRVGDELVIRDAEDQSCTLCTYEEQEVRWPTGDDITNHYSTFGETLWVFRKACPEHKFKDVVRW